MESLTDAAIGGTLTFVACSLMGADDWRRSAATVLATSVCGILTRSLLGLQREKYPLERWIESGQREAALDPDLPIVDAHHHLWDARTQDKGWPVSPLVIRILYKFKPYILHNLMVRGQDPRIVRLFSSLLPQVVPYMINEILRDIENIEQGDAPLPQKSKDSEPLGHNIQTTVYIECGWDDPSARSKAWKAVPEASMAQEVADRTKNRLCCGIVAQVPLQEGADEVRLALKALVERYPNVRGIRQSLACREGLYPFDTAKDLAYGAKFRSGFSLLSEFGLSFDTWLFQDNISELRDLALAFPATTIICDHVAGPVGIHPLSDVRTSFATWKPSIKDLADRCPNVVVKLSGLGLPSCGFGFEGRPTPPSSTELAEAWKPFVLHCINCFGVDRCMFASNFPVDKVSGSYTALFNAYKLIVRDYSSKDKQKLFHDNAVRIYRLKTMSKVCEVQRQVR